MPSRYMSAVAVEELSSKSVEFAMTRYQLLLFPSLAGAILVLGGALNLKPAASQSPLSVGSSPANDPAALAILDQAIATLAPERVQWMETKVWQQVKCEDFVYQASGRLVIASGDRMRFDVNVRVGQTVGKLRLVNNGAAVWQSIQTGREKVVVQRWEMPVLSDTLKTSADVAQARTRLLEEHGCLGLASMLRKLRQGVQSAQLRQQRWNGHEVQIVSAVWPMDDGSLASMPEFSRPRLLLRQCRIYLDAQTSWPHRVEWWGAEQPHQPNQMLVQTEYREPVLNQPLSPERCAGEFALVAQ
jgi:hypothetical protein